MAGRRVKRKGREKTGAPVRRTSRERVAMAAGVTDRRRMRPSGSKICTNHRRRVSLGWRAQERKWFALGIAGEKQETFAHSKLRDTFPGWSTSQDPRDPVGRLFCQPVADFALVINIGRLSPAFPVTPPDMRVRIRRFGGLSYRQTANLGIPSESK
jgi:hypothetical protein